MQRDEIIRFLSEHKNEFEQKFSITKIGLFGSYARGEAREGSDIDIVVEVKKPDLFNLIGIKSSVDVVRLRDKMNKFLKHRIEKDAIYV